MGEEGVVLIMPGTSEKELQQFSSDKRALFGVRSCKGTSNPTFCSVQNILEVKLKNYNDNEGFCCNRFCLFSY